MRTSNLAKIGWSPLFLFRKSNKKIEVFSNVVPSLSFTAIKSKLAEQPKIIAQHRKVPQFLIHQHLAFCLLTFFDSVLKTLIEAKPKPGINTLYKKLLAMRGGSK
jgi:hypothetical protein